MSGPSHYRNADIIVAKDGYKANWERAALEQKMDIRLPEKGNLNFHGARLEVQILLMIPRKVDVKLPGKGNSNSHGARPVHHIISVIN